MGGANGRQTNWQGELVKRAGRQTGRVKRTGHTYGSERLVKRSGQADRSNGRAGIAAGQGGPHKVPGTGRYTTG